MEPKRSYKTLQKLYHFRHCLLIGKAVRNIVDLER